MNRGGARSLGFAHCVTPRHARSRLLIDYRSGSNQFVRPWPILFDRICTFTQRTEPRRTARYRAPIEGTRSLETTYSLARDGLTATPRGTAPELPESRSAGFSRHVTPYGACQDASYRRQCCPAVSRVGPYMVREPTPCLASPVSGRPWPAPKGAAGAPNLRACVMPHATLVSPNIGL